MSAAEVGTQLASLSESLKTANALIDRLARLHLTPGAEPLEGEGGARVELAQEIHDSLKELEEEVENLRQEAEDLQAERSSRRRQTLKDSDESRLTVKTTRLAEELAHSRQRFRNAQITAKFASEEAKRKEREALFESLRHQAESNIDVGDSTSQPNETEQLFGNRGRRQQTQKQLTKDELLVNATSDVTAALRRTHNLLSTELSRSRFAQETFDESTRALNDLGDKYSGIDDILSKSRSLLGTLLRSQKSDTWYLETAFYILIATLCWLFFRRILYGPFFKLPVFVWTTTLFLLNWLVWRPIFFFLSATGVIISEPAHTRSTILASSRTRAPLIVQPSAQGRPEAIPPRAADDIRKIGVPAGAGGAGAKVYPDGVLSGKVSESIGKMAEESSQQDRRPQADSGDQSQGETEQEVKRRGDGTVLEERKEPPNPKKKQFDTTIEESKHQASKRDEL